MHNNSQKLGKEGEERAKDFLRSLGYDILESNWRFKKLEVDLIAKTQQTIVFVEVKARNSARFGEPEVFVTKAKQRFLVAAAQHYLNEKGIDLESRFDIIAVTGTNNSQTVKHLEGAFYPVIK